MHFPEDEYEGEDEYERIFTESYYHTILEKDSPLYHCISNLDTVVYMYIDQINYLMFSLFIKEEDLLTPDKALLSLVGNIVVCGDTKGIFTTKKDTIVFVPQLVHNLEYVEAYDV